IEPCVHARTCGGCNLQHLPAEDQLALKEHSLADQLSRQGLQPKSWAPALTGPEIGYRRRARLAVRWNVAARRLDVGFRGVFSKDFVSIQDCRVLVQPLQPLMQGLLKSLHELENPQVLGHVELFCGFAEAVLIRHTAALADADRERLAIFAR